MLIRIRMESVCALCNSVRGVRGLHKSVFNQLRDRHTARLSGSGLIDLGRGWGTRIGPMQKRNALLCGAALGVLIGGGFGATAEAAPRHHHHAAAATNGSETQEKIDSLTAAV